MAFEEGRLTVVDTRCVEPNGFDRSIGGEPAGRIGTKAGKMKFGNGAGTALVGAQVLHPVGPIFGEPRPQQDDCSVGNLTMLFLPRVEVFDTNQIIAVRFALFGTSTRIALPINCSSGI